MLNRYGAVKRGILTELALEAEEELIASGWSEEYDFDGIFGRWFGSVQILTIGDWAEYHTCVYPYPEHNVDYVLLQHERIFVDQIEKGKGRLELHVAIELRTTLKEIIKFRLLLRIHGKAVRELDYGFTPRLGFGPPAPSTMNVVKDNIPLRI